MNNSLSIENEAKTLFSIIIPVYNEGKRIYPMLEELISTFKNKNYTVEIVFSDDGSQDNSIEILQKFADTNYSWLRCKIVKNVYNMGKGAAVKNGVSHSNGEFILSTDADLSFPLEDIERFHTILKEHNLDAVVGSRYHKESSTIDKASLMRNILSWFFRTIVNISLGIRSNDTNCGFKFFKEETAKRVFGSQLIKGWSYDAESFFLMRKFDIKWQEAPVTLTDREDSRVRIIPAMLQSFWEVFKIRYNDLKGKYS